MKEFIKELIDKYSNQIEKEVIGCGLDYRDNELLDNDVEAYVHGLFVELVGERPTTDATAPEYEQWYRRFLVFCEIMGKLGKQYNRKYTYFPTPKNLATSHGPRD